MDILRKLKCSSKDCLFTTLFFDKLLTHYRNVHSFHHDFFISCNFDSCLKSFSNVKSFQKHVQRKHRDQDNTIQSISRNIETNNQEEIGGHFEAQVNVSEGINHVDQRQEIVGPEKHDPMHYDFDQRLATFLVTMQEKYKVPYSALSYFTREIKSWTEINNDQFEERVKMAAEASGSKPVNYQNLKDEQNCVSAGAADRLSTKWKVDNYLRDHTSSLVEPIQVVLQESDLGKKHTMQYVPILDNIKSLLSHEDILSQVLNQNYATDLLSNYSDGELFSQNPLFKKYPNALQIQLYCDDFTVVNPLGAPGRVREFKITAFYFLLGNLEPKYRSQLDVIQLVALVKATDVKKFGLEKVLQPLLEDIQFLETTGITVKKEDHTFHFHGTISFIASDNLGAHFLGGFQENFSTSKRGCRFCMATRGAWQGVFNDQFPWRLPEAYDKQAQDVTKNLEEPSTYGIKRASPLNSLKYYHIINGLPSDIAHDLLEGVIPTYLEKIITSLIEAGFLTLSQLNEQIRTFPYCSTDKANKPPFMHSTKPKCTQSQMLCFVRLLPLLVGHLVPEATECWKLLGQMLDMLEIICAHQYRRADLAYMHSLIKDFMENAHILYPSIKTKPKAHYLIHYAKETQLFGPLINCWTMRFEAKHSYFKDVSQRSKNHRNVCKTMAERHQRRQAMLRTQSDFLPEHRLSTVQDRECHVELLSEEIQVLLMQFTDRSDIISECKSAKVEGKLYAKDLAVIVESLEDDYVFGLIATIFLVQGSPLLCCKLLTNLQFSSHHHAYEVEESGSYRILKTMELPDPNPLGHYFVHEMKKLLVHCNDKTLPLDVESDQGLEEQIRSTFGLSGKSGINLHYFCKEWNNWLSVVSYSDIPTMSELRVTVVTDVSLIRNEAGHNEQTVHEICLSDGESQKENIPCTPTSEPPSTPTSIHSDASDVDLLSQGLPLPRPFTLPLGELGLTRQLLTKLESGIELDQSDRRKILDGIFQHVTATYRKVYFTRTEYSDIADSLLRHFPYLPASEGLSRPDSQNVWHGRVKHKVKNCRRRYGRNIPAVMVQITKKRQAEAASSPTQPKRIKLVHGVANYLPPQIVGEDRDTIDIHISFLKKQARLDFCLQDQEKITSKMEKTFPHRRELVVMKGLPVVDMRDMFPIIFSKNQVISEYNRICAKNLEQQWQNGFKYIEGLAMLEGPKSEGDLIKNARMQSSSSREEDTQRDATWAIGLLSLPGLMKEKFTDILTIGVEPRHSAGCIHIPRLDQGILQVKQFFVFMDGIQLAECQSLQEAWMVLMAACYVFNIVYPREQKSTMNFCQRVILGIHDDESKDIKVVKLLGRVKKALKRVPDEA